MEFCGIVKDILGYPGRPTFIIEDGINRRDRQVSILDVHHIRLACNKTVDLFLNGNWMVDNQQEVIERLVIVVIKNLSFNHGLFLLPENYMHKEVSVFTRPNII